MPLRMLALLPLVLLTSACFFPTESKNLAPDLPRVQLKPAFKELSFERPIFLCHDGVNRNLIYVVTQDGRIHCFDNREGVKRSEVFLDFADHVFSFEDEGGHNEEGMLGLAFHPKFAENGQFFVSYTAGNPAKRRNVLSRFTVMKDDRRRADKESEVVLWDFEKPYGNHNGCPLMFGQDGMLYAAYGDGGNAGDPGNRAQNLGVLFGKILRIDVNANTYTVPADNPFVNRSGARPEIYAYGFRNPWRMSFDGDNLWVGDVGQDKWEWVHLAKKGGNHGWSLFEGSHRFKDGTPVDPVIKPVAEYSHDVGKSITGGYVYRGQRFPALRGIYFYADFITGRMWGLQYGNGVQRNGEVMFKLKPLTVASFGQDADGELYVCGFDGKIYRLEQEGAAGSGIAGGK